MHCLHLLYGWHPATMQADHAMWSTAACNDMQKESVYEDPQQRPTSGIQKSRKAHRGSLAGQLEELRHQALRDLCGQLLAGRVGLALEALPIDWPLLAGHHVAQVEVQVALVLLPAPRGQGGGRVSVLTQRLAWLGWHDKKQRNCLDRRYSACNGAAFAAPKTGTKASRLSPLGDAQLLCCNLHWLLLFDAVCVSVFHVNGPRGVAHSDAFSLNSFPVFPAAAWSYILLLSVYNDADQYSLWTC